MEININEYLNNIVTTNNIASGNIQLPDVTIDINKIKVIMINEVPPINPEDYFYSKSKNPDYMKTVLKLFQNAGIKVNNICDIIEMGIYITTAVKSPKQEYAIDTEIVKKHLLILEKEIELFPNIRVIMLMGDVAKKAFNMIARKHTKKNVIPSGSTYKIREKEFYFGDIRVFPSYIMTGGNLLIEKSKCTMISDDISRMIKLI